MAPGPTPGGVGAHRDLPAGRANPPPTVGPVRPGVREPRRGPGGTPPHPPPAAARSRGFARTRCPTSGRPGCGRCRHTPRLRLVAPLRAGSGGGTLRLRLPSAGGSRTGRGGRAREEPFSGAAPPLGTIQARSVRSRTP
ncbi:hypothetical protein ADK93_05025 [Streptomyces sp. XY58]|nr:hypothetical protein ADK93_05025 [Streptomyces sp. XY58]KOV10889.1 hypothetical protein ADK89_05005 [Streptomyces sp. XY37]KOV54197.1 hypothetical protein ADK99_05385 [Streptomyces sp. MMG1064]